jgi:hypothetical protein
MQDMDITNGNTFPDKAEVNLYMHGVLMLNGVGG